MRGFRWAEAAEGREADQPGRGAPAAGARALSPAGLLCVRLCFLMGLATIALALSVLQQEKQLSYKQLPGQLSKNPRPDRDDAAPSNRPTGSA
jgi:hypothetical protein